MADATVALQASIPAASPGCGVEPFFDLVKSIAWPVAIAVLVVWFRKPLADFAAAVGGRVSKLEIAQLSIELSSAREPTRTPLLDEIRDPTRSAQLADSQQMLIDQARSSEPADFAVINLGQGEEWLTSRLFIAAAMMERMRGIKVFVFVEATADTERRFVATVDVRRLRWILARRYPWLEVAYVQAQARAYQNENPQSPALASITTDNGALEPHRAQQLVQDFINTLQRPVGGQPRSDQWQPLGQGSEERAAWVTRPLLSELLAIGDFAMSVTERDSMPAGQLSRAVLRRKAAFVPLVDEHRQYLRLVDRRAYLESLAAQAGQEPE
jgi:hypothetical protein